MPISLFSGRREQAAENSNNDDDSKVFDLSDKDMTEQAAEAKLKSKLLRKLDLRLLPLLSILYLLSFIDRSNIGNARLGGLQGDLDLSNSEYQWALSIFFFGYIIFDVPSNIIMRRWRPSYWLAVLMGSWGIVATSMAACTNFAGLAVTRFLLGVTEAGFFPGVIYFLSVWYTRQEYARRIGVFFSFGSLAGSFSGLIAYGVSHIPNDTLATWQWLFIIEGAPSIVLSAFAAWYLPNDPETAKFLTKQEREYEVQRLAQDGGAANDHEWSWAQAVTVFKDWKVYAYMFIYFTGTSALQGVTLFLPSIVRSLGVWSEAQSQALTTPPYLLAFFATLIVSYTSDRTFERGYHMVAINAVGIAGFLMLMFVPSTNAVARYAAVCLVTIAVYANVSPKVAWFNNNFAGLTRRAIASAAIVSVGLVGGVVGGQMFYDPPMYFAGSAIAVSFLLAQTIMVLIVRFVLARENKRRSHMTPAEKEAELARYGSPELVGDRHPDFKYVL